MALTLLLTSCAKNIVTNFQENTENAGKLVVIPNKPVFHASITLQDELNRDVSMLIVRNKNIKTLEVKNIPEGLYKMELTYNNNELRPIKNNVFHVIVKKDKTTNKLIQIPPPSLGNYLVWIGIVAMLLFSSI